MNKSFFSHLLLSTALQTLVFIMPASPLRADPLSLPQGATVRAGTAQIITGDKALTVKQGSQRAVIDWQSFNIGEGYKTTFEQPSSTALAINRIHDNQVSQIDGSLVANGRIMLLNQNGILFGQKSRVDVGGLIAATSDIDVQQAMQDSTVNLLPSVNPNAAIVNNGIITAADAGLVGLVAPTVINNGIIAARLGQVKLGGGDTATVDFAGDGLIQVAISRDELKTVVKNNGILIADGGSIAMTAAAARKTVDSVVYNGGVVQARSVGTKNGKITLFAEGTNAIRGNSKDDKGKKLGSSTAINSGVIDASGRSQDARGGKILVTGDNVALLKGTVIDASGDTGKANTTYGKAVYAEREGSAGGDIRIGGDYLGLGDTATAKNLYVDAGALILNDALSSGDAGRTIFWSDDTTDFYGNVYARALGGLTADPLSWHAISGGATGDGGFVETSGKNKLNAGGYVDLTASNGDKGTYFLDPTDITIYGNFAPDYTSTDGSINLLSGLRLWLDADSRSALSLTYSTDGLSGATASGSLGTNTITTSSNIASSLTPGARIRIGSSGTVTSANTMGPDTYTVASVSGTTITTVEALNSNYSSQTLYRGLVSQINDLSGVGNHLSQSTETNMPLWLSTGLNSRGLIRNNGNDFLRTTSASLDYSTVLASTYVTGKMYSTTPANTGILVMSAAGSSDYVGGGMIVWSSGFTGGLPTGADTYFNGGVIVNNNLSMSNNYIYHFNYYNSSGAIYTNGSLHASTVTGARGGVSPTVISLGSRYVSGSFSNGSVSDINEVFSYNQQLSLSSRHLLDQYQSAKWNIGLTPPGTGADEVARATAADGYSVFTTRYLERLSQSANVSLQATNNINLDLKGDTLNMASGRDLTLTAGNNISSLSNGTVQTNGSGSILLSAGGDINFSHDIDFQAVGTGSVTLRANNDILYSGSGDISTAGGAIVLNSDRDATSIGAISLGSGTQLLSNGGNITLGGGSTPSSGYAFGSSASTTGIRLFGATVDARGTTADGNIIMNGRGASATSSSGVLGISITNGSSVQTEGAGTQTLRGIGGGNGVGLNNQGFFLSTASSIQVENGALTIEGTGGNAAQNGYGVALADAGTFLRSNGSGNISITGTGSAIGGSNNIGLRINADASILSTTGNIDMTAIHGTGTVSFGAFTPSGGTSVIGGAAATGNINVYMNTYATNTGSHPLFRTTGTVNFQTQTAGQSIGIAGSAGGLQLAASLLNSVQATTFNIGRTDSTALMRVSGANLSTTIYNLNLINGSGNIQYDGGTLTLGANRSLSVASTSGNITTATGVGTISTSGTGNITLSRPVTLGQNLTLNGGSSGSVSFGGAVNGPSALTVNAGNISFGGSLGASTALTALSVTGRTYLLGNVLTNNGNIAFNSPLLLGMNSTINAGTGSVTFGDTVDTNYIDLQALLVGGGGGGGGRIGGGGGAGGVVALARSGLTAGTANTVTVGAGGAGGVGASTGSSGQNTTLLGAIAAGGGAGGRGQLDGVSGGSGGGAGGADGCCDPFGGVSAGNSLGVGNTASSAYIVGTVSPTGIYGNQGGRATTPRNNGDSMGGGGGGAGGAGDSGPSNVTTPRNGGIGIQSNISGTTYYYAGGGGAAGHTAANGGAGGLGGGGGGASFGFTGGAGGTGGTANGVSGGSGGNTAGGNGAANTGGGGGAGAWGSGSGGNGGSGVAILRYTGSAAQVSSTNAIVTSVGNDTVLTFNSSGTFSVNGCTSGCDLSVSGSSISFGGTLGGAAQLGQVSLTATDGLTLPSISASSISAITTGAAADITIGGALTATSTSAALTLDAGRSILNSSAAAHLNTTHASGALTLKARDSIVWSNGADITSQGGSITFNSDSDASLSGGIQLGSGTVVTSNGGDITLGGGSTPLTTAAFGTSTSGTGIDLSGASIFSGTGTITLNGQGSSSNIVDTHGIRLRSGSVIETTSGTINMLGTGGAGTLFGANFFGNIGVYARDVGTRISSSTGAINLTGFAGTGALEYNAGFALFLGAGISSTGTGALAAPINISGTAYDTGLGYQWGSVISYIDGSFSSIDGDITINSNSLSNEGGSAGHVFDATTTSGIVLSGDANFTLTGSSLVTGNDILINTGTQTHIGGASATGNITINANSINYLASTPIISTSGNVIFSPRTASGTVGVSGAAGGLEVSAAMLSAMRAGTVMIGRTDGTGLMRVAGTDLSTRVYNLNLLNGSGNIQFDGGTLTMGTNRSLSVSPVTGNITTATAAGTVNTSGTGNITLSRPVTLGQNLTLNTGSAGTLAFGGTVNGGSNLTASAGSMTFNGAWGNTTRLGDVSLTSVNALSTPALTTARVTAETTNSSANLTVGGNINANGAGSAISLIAGRNIISDGRVLTTNGGNQLFRARAAVNIGSVTGSSFSSGGGNITLHADSDNSLNDGFIFIRASTIATSGGDFIAGGGLDPSMTAVRNPSGYGIELFNTSISTSTGNVNMRGSTGASGFSDGITMRYTSPIVTTSGSIFISGTAAATGGTAMYGVSLDEATLTSGSGSINISGSGGSTGGVRFFRGITVNSTSGNVIVSGTGTGANSHGIHFNRNAAGYNVINSGSGTLTLNGIASASGTGIFSNAMGGTYSIGNGLQTGDIFINANSTNFTSTPMTFQTTGNINISPWFNGNTVGLNGAAGSVSIPLSQLTAANVTIGRTDGTGLMRVAGADLSTRVYNLNLLNGSGNIQFDGGTLTMGTNRSLSVSPVTGNITTATAAGTVNTSGTGNITLSRPVTLGQNLTLNTGSAGTLAFGGTVNGGSNLTASAGSMTFNGAWGGSTPLSNISLTSQGALSLPQISAASLFARTAGATSDLTLAGNITASQSSGDAITLASARHFINSSGFALNTSSTGRWLVYSQNPSSNSFGGLTSNFRRFSCSYGGACPSFASTGNGFLYSYTPLLSVVSADPAYVYGSAAGSLMPVFSNYLDTDSADDSISGSVVWNNSYVQGDNAGTAYAISRASDTLVSALGYGFTFNTFNGTVAKRAITASVQNKSVTYGDSVTLSKSNVADVVWNNMYNAESGSVLDTVIFDYGGYAQGSNAGSYTLDISGFADNNYILSIPAGVTAGTLTVGKKLLNGTVGNKTLTYGDATPVYGKNDISWTGFYGTDDVNDLTSASISNGGYTQGANTGSYTLSATGLTAANYQLGTVTNGTLSVIKRHLNAVIQNKSGVYGDPVPSLSALNPADIVWSNFYGTDNPGMINSITFGTGGYTPTSPAGVYTMSIALFSDENYSLGSVTNGLLTITGSSPPVMTVDDIPSTVISVGSQGRLPSPEILPVTSKSNSWRTEKPVTTQDAVFYSTPSASPTIFMPFQIGNGIIDISQPVREIFKIKDSGDQ